MKFLLIVILACFLIASCGHSVPVMDDPQVSVLEEYLIDFSKKIEGYKLKGGTLPADLDSEKFFAILSKYYPRQDMIQAVLEYPVKVHAEGDDYVLTLCDKDSKFILLRDLGKTTDKVDFRYRDEGKQVECN